MANEIKAKDRVKWSHNGGYLFGTAGKLITSDISVGSEKISASEKSPVLQVELFTGQTTHVAANLCEAVDQKEFEKAATDIIGNILANTGIAGFEWGCDAYKTDAAKANESLAKMQEESKALTETLAKTKDDYESMCKAKSDLEAQIATLQAQMQKAADEHASFKADTVAKERFAQLTVLEADKYLDEDPSKVLSLVRAMDESQFANIIKVATAAKAGKPTLTDQTQTNLPKLTDQTQTNLTKLTQADAQDALDNATVQADPALANVTNTSNDKKSILVDFVRANLKSKKKEKNSKS